MVPKAALVLLEFQVLVPCKVLRTRIFSIIALLSYGELVLEIAPVCIRYDSSPISLSKSLLLRSHLVLLSRSLTSLFRNSTSWNLFDAGFLAPIITFVPTMVSLSIHLVPSVFRGDWVFLHADLMSRLVNTVTLLYLDLVYHLIHYDPSIYGVP